LRPHIKEYRIPAITVLVALGIALWPGILSPLAQAYVRLCDYFLRNLPPVLHHHPPYVVARVLPIVALLISAITYAVARQVVRQRRPAAAFAVKTRPAGK
jgi:hypothetical protein